MRVISGTNKGKKLFTPKNNLIRPTTDKIKESVFNIIGNINHDSVVLDLFSGTGNMGIEFLSRGAKNCCFIDDNYKSIELTKKNIESCKQIGKSMIYKNDYERSIKIFGSKNKCFDYIYADPPYAKKFAQNILDCVIKENILKKEGLLIIECDDSEKICIKKYNNMLKYESRRYGRTRINFITYMEDCDESYVFGKF